MASTYLTRTPSSAGSTRKMTISFWYKKCANGSQQTILSQNNSGATVREMIRFQTNDTFSFYTNNGSYQEVNTNRVFRDNSAFYHIVIEVDTTQATAADRVKIYVNGVQETSFATSNYPAQNFDFTCYNSTNLMVIGRDSKDNNTPVDGVMAHFHFIDGTAYDASYFGETETSSGIWKPKTSPSVTYGTNGFFLKFGNSGSLGTDSSGNGNNFTVNGSGTQTLDTPSNVFATWDPLNTYPTTPPVLSNGNTTVVTVNADPGYFGASSTLGVSSGKWYWEVEYSASTSGTAALLGVSYNPAEMARNGATFNSQVSAAEYMYYSNGNKYNNTTSSAYGDSYAVGDIIGIALDLDNNYIYFAKNGTWQNSGDPTSGATGTGAAFNITSGQTYFAASTDGGGLVSTYDANFGNGYFGTTAVASANSDSAGIGQFEYAVPSGYYALCTKNIASYG